MTSRATRILLIARRSTSLGVRRCRPGVLPKLLQNAPGIPDDFRVPFGPPDSQIWTLATPLSFIRQLRPRTKLGLCESDVVDSN